MDKACFKCERVKPLTDFYRHPETADGHLNKCKICTREDVQQNYRANSDHYRAYDRKRANRPHRVAARRAYAISHPDVVARHRDSGRSRYPERYAARIAVGNAVRDGKVTKAPTCQVCLRSRPLHGHHEDYTKPLAVAWLCTTCHRRVHRGTITLGRQFTEARERA